MSTKEELTEMMEEAISSFFSKRDEVANIQRDEHHEHHAWLRERISKEAEKAEFWRNIRAKSVPWALAALISAAGTGAWTAFKIYFEEHWK